MMFYLSGSQQSGLLSFSKIAVVLDFMELTVSKRLLFFSVLTFNCNFGQN